MIWSLIYNNPEIELRVVLRDIGSADTLSVLMNTFMQYTLSTWSLLFGMNGSSCGLWHRHFAWTQITLVLIGKGMLLDGSTLKTRTTLMNTATDSYYACEYACLNMYLYIYLLICTYVCILCFSRCIFRAFGRSLGFVTFPMVCSGQAWARSFGRPIQVALHRWDGSDGKVVHVQT